MQQVLSVQIKELLLVQLKKCYKMIYNLPYVFSSVRNTLTSLGAWAMRWGMEFNVNKSKIIAFNNND